MASPKQQQHRKRAGGRPLVLRRAMLHSCVCFVVGLVTGLAPSDWADAASRAAANNAQVLTTRAARAMNHTAALLATHYQLRYYQQQEQQRRQEKPQQLVIAITTTAAGQSSSDRERRSAGLTRTAHALRLVSPPVVVVWLVVEPAREAPPTAALLRRTGAGAGLAYRHLTYADNFTADAWEEERHHQRNVALAHVEQHRLRGVVLFAGLADVYDLRLLDNLRHIRTLGAWPVATVWEQERRVAVQGPLCSSSSSSNGSSSGSAVSAWFSSPSFSSSTAAAAAAASSSRPAPDSSLDAGFAFASDLLWDPARWDRFPTSEPDHSQDSIDFVHRLLLEDYNKTRPIPDCSHIIMAWRVDTTLL